jgi:hypothetical protein
MSTRFAFSLSKSRTMSLQHSIKQGHYFYHLMDVQSADKMSNHKIQLRAWKSMWFVKKSYLFEH